MKNQNKRNIKKNRKQINRKLQSLNPTTKNQQIKETIKIDDSYPMNPNRNQMELMMDIQSDLISQEVTKNWNSRGNPFSYFNGENGKQFEEIENLKKYDSKMFKEFGTKNEFYHLTSPKNWYKIKKYGFKSIGVNRTSSMGYDGKIWVVESSKTEIWNYVGYNQLTIGVENLPIVVVKINQKGITGRISSEDGNDFPTLLHSVIHQNEIEPKYLEKVGVFYTNRELYYNLKPTLSKLKNDFYTNESDNKDVINFSYKMVG